MSVQWRTRRSLGVLAASLLTAALLAAPGAGTASAASCELWTGVPPPSPGAADNELAAVTAPGPCNVWAVGFYRDTADGQALSLAEHWNGTAWAVVPTPSPDANINFLSAVSEASLGDMWAVGDTDSSSTFILHWNRVTWTQVPSPNPSSSVNILSGVAAVSATEAWAVGQYFAGASGDSTLVLRWNGQNWTQTTAPAPGSQSVLNAVTATSAGNAWAVGSFVTSSGPKTLIEHWNGTKWAQVPSPNPAGPLAEIELDAVAATSASDAWAVGAYNTNNTDKTLIEHWDGHTWKLVPSPNPAPHSRLVSVAATSAGNAWAVGTRTGTIQQTLILRWNGTAWKLVPSPNPGEVNALGGVATTSATDVWAVGSFTTGGLTQVLAAHCC
jgi:hypothetical protein